MVAQGDGEGTAEACPLVGPASKLVKQVGDRLETGVSRTCERGSMLLWDRAVHATCNQCAVHVQHQRLYEADGHVSVRLTPILPGALFDTQRGFHCVFIR